MKYTDMFKSGKWNIETIIMSNYQNLPVKPETKERIDNLFSKSMTYNEIILWMLDNLRSPPIRPLREIMSVKEKGVMI